MRDSDSEYPLHQPRRNGHRRPFDDETEDELEREHEIEEEKRHAPRFRRQGPLHQREVATSPQLPAHRLQNALIIGAVAGIISAVQGIIITVANASIYVKANTTPQNQLALGVAEALVGLLCLSLFINLVIYLVAGFATGKITVERRMGLVAGFVGAVVANILGYLVVQIPAYPGASKSGFNGGLIGIGGGLLVGLIFLILSGLIAGLVSYLGAWLATRRHPYYIGYEE